jgi:hypothetical protein
MSIYLKWYSQRQSNVFGKRSRTGACVIEGYFGVGLSKNSLVIAPRLGVNNGSISLYERTSYT